MFSLYIFGLLLNTLMLKAEYPVPIYLKQEPFFLSSWKAMTYKIRNKQTIFGHCNSSIFVIQPFDK